MKQIDSNSNNLTTIAVGTKTFKVFLNTTSAREFNLI